MFRTLSLHSMSVVLQDFRLASPLFFGDQTTQLHKGTYSVLKTNEGLGCRTKASIHAFTMPGALGAGYPSLTK